MGSAEAKLIEFCLRNDTGEHIVELLSHRRLRILYETMCMRRFEFYYIYDANLEVNYVHEPLTNNLSLCKHIYAAGCFLYYRSRYSGDVNIARALALYTRILCWVTLTDALS